MGRAPALDRLATMANLSIRIAAACAALAVAACTTTGPRTGKEPSPMFSALRVTEHRGSDDLLTAGLGGDGVAYSLASFVDSASVQAVDNRKFGSRHPGICQFALCDGSVRPIPVNIDLKILTRLGNREDGESIGDF
jgi:hypothetical protein